MEKLQTHSVEDIIIVWLERHGATCLLVFCGTTLVVAFVRKYLETGNLNNDILPCIVCPLFLAIIFSVLNRF
jgi:hypothetical protein